MAMTDRPGLAKAGPAQGRSGRGGALAVTTCDEAVLALLVGDLGVAEAEQLRRRLIQDLPAKAMRIVVDASAATSLCGEVMSVLQEVSRLAATSDGELVVVDPPPALLRHLRRCGIRVRATRIGGPGRS